MPGGVTGDLGAIDYSKVYRHRERSHRVTIFSQASTRNPLLSSKSVGRRCKLHINIPIDLRISYVIIARLWVNNYSSLNITS